MGESLDSAERHTIITTLLQEQCHIRNQPKLEFTIPEVGCSNEKRIKIAEDETIPSSNIVEASFHGKISRYGFSDTQTERVLVWMEANGPHTNTEHQQ